MRFATAIFSALLMPALALRRRLRARRTTTLQS